MKEGMEGEGRKEGKRVKKGRKENEGMEGEGRKEGKRVKKGRKEDEGEGRMEVKKAGWK